MREYQNKTKEELISIIYDLETKIIEANRSQSFQSTGKVKSRFGERILDIFPDMVTVLDYQGNIVELISSPRSCHIEGIDEEHLLHANIEDVLPQKAYQSVWLNIQNVIQTGQDQTARHHLQLNGETHYYENHIFPLDRDYLLCICRDITSQWKAEQLNEKQHSEIVRLNFLMEAILNNIPVYLFIKDSGNDFRYLYFNKAFAESSGIPIKKAIGRSDSDLFPRAADAVKFRQDDLRVLKEKQIEYITDYMTADGEIRFVNTLKKTVNSGGEHPYIIGVSWDITDVKETEKELTIALKKAEEADRLKSAFLANMSHEIRTPLNAIVGFSKLICGMNNETEQEKMQYAQIVEQNSEILLNLFNDIIDLSSLETNSMTLRSTPIRIFDVCLQLKQRFEHSIKEQVSLILDNEKSDLYVVGDWDRITQIIANLLNNAIKFTLEGEIHYGFSQKEDMVEFYVKDTGIGIPAEKASRIFERFGKLDNFVQGTGLGLTICRLLVEKMGGHIWVRSRVNQGTTFYFTLPLYKTAYS